jgi:hypothetical protein
MAPLLPDRNRTLFLMMVMILLKNPRKIKPKNYFFFDKTAFASRPLSEWLLSILTDEMFEELFKPLFAVHLLTP